MIHHSPYTIHHLSHVIHTTHHPPPTSPTAHTAQHCHPNICALIGHSEDGPSRVLVYEYCANGALYDRIACSMGGVRLVECMCMHDLFVLCVISNRDRFSVYSPLACRLLVTATRCLSHGLSGSRLQWGQHEGWHSCIRPPPTPSCTEMSRPPTVRSIIDLTPFT